MRQKNFMLLVTETNHGLAYDKDVKVSFETFYYVIIVAMVINASRLNAQVETYVSW